MAPSLNRQQVDTLVTATAARLQEFFQDAASNGAAAYKPAQGMYGHFFISSTDPRETSASKAREMIADGNRSLSGSLLLALSYLAHERFITDQYGPLPASPAGRPLRVPGNAHRPPEEEVLIAALSFLLIRNLRSAGLENFIAGKIATQEYLVGQNDKSDNSGSRCRKICNRLFEIFAWRDTCGTSAKICTQANIRAVQLLTQPPRSETPTLPATVSQISP